MLFVSKEEDTLHICIDCWTFDAVVIQDLYLTTCLINVLTCYAAIAYFYIGWEQRKLASRNFRRWLRQNSVHISTVILLYMCVLWIEKCASNFSASNWRFTQDIQEAVCPFFFRKRDNNFASSRRAYRPRLKSHYIYYTTLAWHWTLKKSRIFSNRLEYVGNVIRSGRFRVPTCTINAIFGLKYPTPVMAIRSFLCLCNSFCRYGQCFALVAPQLSKNLSNFNGRPFTD